MIDPKVLQGLVNMNQPIGLAIGLAIGRAKEMSQLPPSPAESMCNRLRKSIIEFERKLDYNQEIGARLTNFSEREPIHIDEVSYWGNDLIIFRGTNADDYPVELLQHVSQISVLLVAVPKQHETPRRIGFEFESRPVTSETDTK